MSFESLTRNVHAILSFYNEKSELVDISKAITSISVKQITCSNSELKMGEFCQNSLEFSYAQDFLDEKIQWNNKRVKLSFTEGTTTEEKSQNTVDIGIFYVQAKDVETSDNGKSYTVTAYDLPSVMSEEFDNTKCGNTVAEIVSYISSISGMEFVDGTTFSLDKVESVEEGLSNSGLLAYIAGYDGKNIRTTADGKLETYWYYSNTDSTHFKGQISRSVQYIGEFTDGSIIEPLNAITSGSNEGVISVGSGTSLTYTNPYINEEQLETILTRVKGFDYSIGSVKFRGNPNFRCGDTVQVETNEGEYVLFPIMEQTINFDGGMNATCSAYTYETENTVMGSGGSVDKKISKVYSGLTASFQKQTGLINTNLKGGYYRLLQDTDTKYPYGWLIADSEEIASTTKGWRWTQEGLMYSTDGFKTADRFAFTSDGHLSAEMISASSITTDKLILEFGDTSKMIMQGNSTGVEFVGTGTFTNKSVGNFQLYNYVDSEYSTLKNAIFTNTDKPDNYYRQGIWIDNYQYNSSNKANYIYLIGYENKNLSGIENKNFGDTTTANLLRFDSLSTYNRSTVVNYAETKDVIANRLYMNYGKSSGATNLSLTNNYNSNNANILLMTGTSGNNSVKLSNIKHDSSTIANFVYMRSANDSYGNYMQLWNYEYGSTANLANDWYLQSSSSQNYCSLVNKRNGSDYQGIYMRTTSTDSECYLTIKNSYSCYLTMTGSQNVVLSAPNSMTIQSTNYNVYLYGKALYWNDSQKW